MLRLLCLVCIFCLSVQAVESESSILKWKTFPKIATLKRIKRSNPYFSPYGNGKGFFLDSNGGVFSVTPPPFIVTQEKYIYPKRQTNYIRNFEPRPFQKPSSGLVDDSDVIFHQIMKDYNNNIKKLEKYRLEKFGYTESDVKKYPNTPNYSYNLNKNYVPAYNSGSSQSPENFNTLFMSGLNSINYNPNNLNSSPYNTNESPYSIIENPYNINSNHIITYNSKDLLPKPENLRLDYDANTDFSNINENIVPPPRAAQYVFESVKDLPLADHMVKTKQNSYSVPYYSVTSQHYTTTRKPELKISDSYVKPNYNESQLKAVAIWSAKSEGASYTLHEDGTLSAQKGY